MTRFFWMILIAALLSACGAAGPGSQQESLPTSPSSLPAGWTIRFTQSGGIMGMMRSMDIKSDGEFTVTDERTGKTVTSRLTPGQLSQLEKLALESSYAPGSKPSGCADCFNYTVEINTGIGKPVVGQFNDVSLEGSGMSSLVTYLRGLMENTLKNQ